MSLDALYLSTQQQMVDSNNGRGEVRLGKELATLPHHTMAHVGTFLTRCSPTLI